MSTTRRALTLIGLTLAVFAAAVPASATFADQAAVVTTVGTVTVAAPVVVNTEKSWCNNGVLQADLWWSQSTTARVSGYTVTAYYQGTTSKVIGEVNAATTTFSGVVPNFGQSKPTALTVTTRTTYGWTMESPRTAVLAC